MNTKKIIFSSSLLVALFFAAAYFFINKNEDIKPEYQRIRSSSSPKAEFKMKAGRDDYFFYMLRDPSTNNIPRLIREKELQFVKKLNKNSLQKTTATWTEAGPNNVGGRTRALAVDVSNPNTIIAGGAGGGIWKSTDNGTTWVMKSSLTSILSVTSIAQDPRPGQTNNWYYTAGEFRGSGSDYSYAARFSGDGVYKSTDNGETWNRLASTHSPNVTQWDSFFDWVSKIVVNPANGDVYLASNGVGIMRSTNGGESFTKVLGDPNHHIYSDVDVASDGTVLAILSGPFQGVTAAKAPGLYKSTNGIDWTNIPLNNYPSTAERSVVKIAPSNPNVAYVMTYIGTKTGQKDNVYFYKVNISAATSENRSNNLPDFSSQQVWDGYINTQSNYNMTLAVKPDNENFVLIAGTCLFLSTDGFATKPNNKKSSWIGGYNTEQTGQYPNFHPDIHSFAFDPTNPNKMWWGHDGGLSYTSDITNTSFQNYFPWDTKNNGYNVTQFYHISISDQSGDNRIMGGTQDNGTPYFVFNGSLSNQLIDVSSGDGSFSYFGQNYAFTSSQSGALLRLKYDQQNNPAWDGWSELTPTGASNQLFINPFCVDPNNENVIYYPAGGVMWRNDQVSSIPDYQQGTSTGWTQLTGLSIPSGHIISAMNISKNPAHILYYAVTNYQSAPRIYKLTNSTTATSGATEISIPNAAEGAYVHDIAINPDDANEILIVMSNYNIVGLYHSTNGGQSYTAVEGNLEGTQENPGPSLRAATILTGTGYYLATSVGVFSTTQLNGNSTNWTQEGQNVIGNVIVNHITSRKSDGRIVAATHGRGAFVGSGGGGGSAVLNSNITQLNIEVQPGLSRTGEFLLSNGGGAGLSFNISVAGGPGKIVPSETAIPKKLPAEMTQPNLHFDNISTEISKVNEDELILDDGNVFPDQFFGPALQGLYFYWLNEFVLEKDFVLEKIKFYMKTETSNSNTVDIHVYASDGSTILYSALGVNTDPSSTGKWYEHNIPQNSQNLVTFSNGNKFYIQITTFNLLFPAGYDEDAQKPGHSYWAYCDPDPNFPYCSPYTLAAGNTAWLIRAVGNTGGGGGGTNQNPIANAQVSPNPAQVNQTVNFNGSGSSDPDGQITSYFWEFGDGQTSNQMNTTHSYSQAGQYTYKLTVTDNNGATNQAMGQITVSSGPSRWTITPASGNIGAGGSQLIKVTFNAEGLAEGNYQAQLNITSSAGNMNIPISIFVSNTVDVDDEPNKILTYKLEQNYPNPFNPETKIKWSIPESGEVSLVVYDLTGQEVVKLVDEYREAGFHESSFNSRNLNSSYPLTSGVYFYRIKAGNFVETKKFVLLK